MSDIDNTLPNGIDSDGAIMTNGELNLLVLQRMEERRVWLNAHACLDPSPEFLIELGAEIVAMLRYPPMLLPSLDLSQTMQSPIAEGQIVAQSLYIRAIMS